MTLSIEQIADLFTGLNNLPKAVNREPTFMEIAGYPHFENVCSNILAFYLQPSNNHGFGTLFLDVLATLVEEEIVIDGEGVQLRREEPTKKGNRIDLVIESDNYVFGIENKIYADLNNPFCDYSKHLDSLGKDRQVYKLLLSLRSVQPSPQLFGFYPISYEVFFQKVLTNISLGFLTGHEPHTTFLRDFIQTIQNLQKSNVEFETSIGNPWRLIYTGIKNSHPYETEIEDIRMWMIDMLKRLTASTADRSTDSNTSFTNLIPVGQSNPPIPLPSKPFSLNN